MLFANLQQMQKQGNDGRKGMLTINSADIG